MSVATLFKKTWRVIGIIRFKPVGSRIEFGGEKDLFCPNKKVSQRIGFTKLRIQ